MSRQNSQKSQQIISHNVSDDNSQSIRPSGANSMKKMNSQDYLKQPITERNSQQPEEVGSSIQSYQQRQPQESNDSLTKKMQKQFLDDFQNVNSFNESNRFFDNDREERKTMHEIYDDQDYGLTQKQRNHNIKKNFKYMIFEVALLVLSAYVVSRAKDNYHEWWSREQIQDKCYLWICVYMALYLFYVLKRVIVILYWCCSKDPRLLQAKINCLTFSFLQSFEIIWFIYGNFILYGTVFKDFTDQNLWKLMIFIMIYGYIQMTVYFTSVCAAGLLIFTMYSDGYFNTTATQEYRQRLEQRNANQIAFDPEFIQAKLPNVIGTNSVTYSNQNSPPRLEQSELIQKRKSTDGMDKKDSISRSTMNQIIDNGKIRFKTQSISNQEVEVYKFVPQHELPYIIEDREECSMCMNYFKMNNTNDELKIVKSNIEAVNAEVDIENEGSNSDNSTEYLYYHLQCFNKNFKQEDIVKYCERKSDLSKSTMTGIFGAIKNDIKMQYQ